MIKLIFVNQAEVPFKEADFTPLLKKAITLLEIPEQEVELVLINNQEIQKINQETRGKDEPTDVLSFANREIEDKMMRDEHSLGQIFISVETAAKNAAEIEQSLEEEVKFLFIHGLLHCLGYDHQDSVGEEEMKKMAYQILGRA